MDVKIDFLNCFIKEEEFLKQLVCLKNPSCPNYVFKLSKSLYGLKQAPKAWYERLTCLEYDTTRKLVEKSCIEEWLVLYIEEWLVLYYI